MIYIQYITVLFSNQEKNHQAYKRITEPRKELSEDEAEAISNTLNKLRVGTAVKIRYYDIDAYTNIERVVTELNPPYRRLKVVKTAIPFDDIYTIEMLGKDVIF